MANQLLERYCRGCGKPLVRHQKETFRNYGKRRYCSHSCYMRVDSPKTHYLKRGAVIEWSDPLDKIDEDMIW